MIDFQFTMGPEGPEFADPEANKHYEAMGKEMYTIYDYDEEDLKKFFQKSERFFIYDSGSGDSDYPPYYGWCKDENEINIFLDNQDVYNHENLFVYDLKKAKQFSVIRTYSLAK